MNPFSLFLLFAKIALLTFGGGYAMIPLFQYELAERLRLIDGVKKVLIESNEFANLIALAQVTPGPIGLNAATYIGYQQAGFWGSLCATVGVVVPSLVLVVLMVYTLNRIRNNRYFIGTISGIRAVTLGLIFSAVIFFANTSVFKAPLASLWQGKASEFGVAWSGVIIFVVTFILQRFTKLSVLMLMIIAAGLGMGLSYLPL